MPYRVQCSCHDMQLPCLMKYCLPCLLSCMLPCSMKILFCHACSGAFSLLNEVQLPCLMHCASIGACWHANANVNWKKCYIGDTYAEMQLPCLIKCICHVCWNAIAMFTQLYMPCLNKRAVAMFYAMCFHWGMLVWKMTMSSWKCTTIAMSSVLHLPCLVCCICHV